MMFFDFRYLLFVSPAIILMIWAQYKVKSTYAAAEKMPATMSGARAARDILDAAGLQSVDIEQVPGKLSDHYDPRSKVLRLSQGVYNSRSLAAVGIAAHEAGHAIQDARGYLPLMVRNAAVPAASFGGNAAFLLIIAGFLLSSTAFGPLLIWAGIICFGCVAFFQVVNLPVEFNASSRAKQQLLDMAIVSPQDMTHVNRVLDAAAMTYVAATLQSVLTLMYYLMRFTGRD